MPGLFKFLYDSYNRRFGTKKARDGQYHVVKILNQSSPRFIEGKEQEIIKQTIALYEEGKNERELGLALIIAFGIVCCLDVSFLDKEILIKLF